MILFFFPCRGTPPFETPRLKTRIAIALAKSNSENRLFFLSFYLSIVAAVIPLIYIRMCSDDTGTFALIHLSFKVSVHPASFSLSFSSPPPLSFPLLSFAPPLTWSSFELLLQLLTVKSNIMVAIDALFIPCMFSDGVKYLYFTYCNLSINY